MKRTRGVGNDDQCQMRTRIGKMTGVYVIIWVFIPLAAETLKYTPRGPTPAVTCGDQRRQLYECLAALQDEMQMSSINITLKVLSDMIVDPFMAQDGLLEKYEGVIGALAKCRKLDPMFDACSPLISTPVTHRSNESLYILDKLECMKLAHSHPTLHQIKAVVADNIESYCFQRAVPVLNPCVPNEAFQKCMEEELLKVKLLWLVNMDVGSQHFAKAYDEAKKEKLSRWRCFECVYLTEEKCRPSILQHDCALGQTTMKGQAFGSVYKQCMTQKSYANVSAYMPDPKLYLRGGASGKADFCSWIIDDLWM